MASHDLKNPLASVTAHVEMIRTAYADALGEDFRQDLVAIERGLGRMGRLTQDLLDYARADHILNLGTVSLEEIVANVVIEHRFGAGGASLITVGTLPNVVADATLLRHVLDNLIGNAIKYTPAGALPQIDVSARTLADGATRVEVADRGIGVPSADRPKVFDPFHRSRNSTGYPGTGLGLSICHRIVEQHGGRMGVDENPGGGSRFWFTISALHLLDDRDFTISASAPAR